MNVLPLSAIHSRTGLTPESKKGAIIAWLISWWSAVQHLPPPLVLNILHHWLHIYVIFCNVLILTFMTSLLLFFFFSWRLSPVNEASVFSHHRCWCDVMQARFGGAAYTAVPVTAQRERSGFYFSVLFDKLLIATLFCREREKREKEKELKRKKKKERIYLRVVGAPVTGEGNNVLFRHIPEIIHSDFHFWRGYFKDSSLLYEKKPWSAITWWYLSFCFNDTEIIFPGVKKDVIWQSVSCSANTAHPDANSRNTPESSEKEMNTAIHWCPLGCTVKQTLTPDFVTAEGTLLQRMLDIPALPSGSSPSASPGIIVTSGTCSWGAWWQPQHSLCHKGQRKYPVCFLNMLHQNDKRAGWAPKAGRHLCHLHPGSLQASSDPKGSSKEQLETLAYLLPQLPDSPPVLLGVSVCSGDSAEAEEKLNLLFWLL